MSESQNCNERIYHADVVEVSSSARYENRWRSEKAAYELYGPYKLTCTTTNQQIAKISVSSSIQY